MLYLVGPENEVNRKLGDDGYVSFFVTDDPTKAEDHAKRRAAKAFGVSEQIIFKQVGITKTEMPKEVTVTL